MLPAVTAELRDISLDADASPPADPPDFHPSGNGHEGTRAGAGNGREPAAGNHVAQAWVRSAWPRDRKHRYPRRFWWGRTCA